MRKFTKPLTALCCFAMLCTSLCACSGETESTAPENTSSIKTEKQREMPEESTELSISFGSADTGDLADTENESGITITGNPLSPEQLADFELNYEWTKNYVDRWYVGEFLDDLNAPVFKDLYCKALGLVRLISTDNIIPTDAVTAQSSERAQLEIDGEYGYYVESGYTYESFVNAFYSAFTKETADIIFSRYPFFYSYNGEMWYKPVSAGGDTGIYQEYELISQTDTELEFKRISYSVPIGEPLSDYDPARKDEYVKSEVEFLFVKTADGWRAEKFLNATDYDKSLLPA